MAIGLPSNAGGDGLLMELLIRIVNRGDGGPGDSQAGDLIAAMPDGFAWGEVERTAPFWRIVRVGLVQAEVNALLASHEPTSLADTFRRRKYTVGIDNFPATAKTILLAPRTGDGVIDARAYLSGIRAAAKLKAVT